MRWRTQNGERSRQRFENIWANAGTKTKDVVAALKVEKDIRVSGPMLNTLKGKVGRGDSRRGAAVRRMPSLSIDDLVAAKKLADQLGGVEKKARAAIAVLGKLV